MNPYYSVGKSSSLVLSASSIVTIRGKGDAKEEAFSVVSLVYLGGSSGGCTAVAEGLGEQAHPIQY
jgi:hypothetical protein